MGRFLNDRQGALSPTVILGIGIAVLFLSAVIPSALDNFFAADTGNWSPAVASLWVLIPLALVAALVFVFLPRNKGGAT